MKANGDVDARVHILAATALKTRTVVNPTPGRLYPGKYQYSFCRRLSGPHDQSGHEEVKKNLNPLPSVIELGPSSL